MQPLPLTLPPPPRCPPPPRVDAQAALRRRVYNVSAEPDLRVLWRQEFRAFAHDDPLSVRELSDVCRILSHQQWPSCARVGAGSDARPPSAARSPSEAATAAVAAARQRPVRRRRRGGGSNTLMLVSMPCSFTDGGANFRGALYDTRRVLNAQHRSATPRFARGPVRRYSVAAVGLTPYGHLADAHFYASTAPWVLTLLQILPDDVPILVSLTPRLRELYARLGVEPARLHTLPPNGAAYADSLLSLVTTPFGALEPLGASALRRVRARLVPAPPPPAQRLRVVLLSRADMGHRRSLKNEAALVRGLTDAARAASSVESRALASASAGGGGGGGGVEFSVEVFSGSRRLTLAQTAELFSRAALLTGPHGGAFLNMIYAQAGTPVVEVGYRTSRPMAYPSYYHTMARRLGLPFWLVLGAGAYDRPIVAPLDELVPLIAALLRDTARARRRGDAAPGRAGPAPSEGEGEGEGEAEARRRSYARIELAAAEPRHSQ